MGVIFINLNNSILRFTGKNKRISCNNSQYKVTRQNQIVNFRWNSINIFTQLIYCITIIISYLQLSTHGQQYPSIVHITPAQSVDLGETVDLSCSVQYGSGYPIIWTKLGDGPNAAPLFISRDAVLSVLDNRYSIRHDDSSSTYTIQISKIQETDAGLYQCQVVTSPTSRITADTSLTVRIPPIISDNSSRGVIAGVGDTFSLNCFATGFPKPKISWRRENNGLLPTGGVVEKGNTITIYNASKDDRGPYYCLADNGVGKSARRSVAVEIEFPPQVNRVSAIYQQAIGFPAELYCSVEASPKPDISWLKDGYQINNDNNFYRITSISSNDFIHTTLHIKSVDQRDFGRYRCRAINKLGDKQIEIELLRAFQPICPPACTDGEYRSISTSSAMSTKIPFNIWMNLTYITSLIYMFMNL